MSNEARAVADKIREARKACHCLFAQVPEEVARGVMDTVDAALTGYATALRDAKAQGMEECLDIVKVRIQQRVEAISITSLIRADVVRRKLSREIEELQEVVNEIRARAAAIWEGKP